ncbi:MAG TPA: cupin domain-containing protein [Candidatus Methanofastidiosum sp.]|nr:cupin domain-containing protein [Methanofastidiosum sp.]
MYFNNLIENNYFSDKEPNKIDLIKSEKFNIVTVYFMKNQEIPPHPEPYAVFFYVIKGKGVFTNKEGKFELGSNQGIFVDQDEIRGIKCLEDMVIVGVQDGH